MAEQAKKGGRDGVGEEKPQPVHVILDTSALRREVADSVGLKHLQWAVEKGAVRVMIPELVLRELVTGLAEEFKRWASSTAEAGKALSWCATGGTHAAAAMGVEAVQVLAAEIEASLAAGVKARMEALKAQVLPITQSATEAAWGMYFEGSGPMKQPKCRADIPDAFIVAIAHEAQKSVVGMVHVIVSDGPMKKGYPKECFTLHQSLADFNRSEAVKAVVKSVSGWPSGAAYEQWKTRLLKLLEDEHPHIQEQAESSLQSALEGERVSAGFFPSDDQEGDLVGDNSIETMELHTGSIEELGPDAVLVPATLHVVDALVDLAIYHADAWTGNAEHFRVYSADENEHYVGAQGYISLLVEAVLRIDLEHDEESNAEDEFAIESVSVDAVTSIKVKNPDWYTKNIERALRYWKK